MLIDRMALRRVNKIREKEFGLAPLQSLPAGKPGATRHCVIANAFQDVPGGDVVIDAKVGPIGQGMHIGGRYFRPGTFANLLILMFDTEHLFKKYRLGFGAPKPELVFKDRKPTRAEKREAKRQAEAEAQKEAKEFALATIKAETEAEEYRMNRHTELLLQRDKEQRMKAEARREAARLEREAVELRLQLAREEAIRATAQESETLERELVTLTD